jgi:acyl carrier protein
MNLEALQHLVELQLGCRGVRAGDRLVEDLGAVSMDLMNLAAAIEERTGVFLPEAGLSRVDTVLDLYELWQQAAGGPRA